LVLVLALVLLVDGGCAPSLSGMWRHLTCCMSGHGGPMLSQAEAADGSALGSAAESAADGKNASNSTTTKRVAGAWCLLDNNCDSKSVREIC
jgi:hypothetical protein